MTRVALVKTRDRQAGLNKALDLLGITLAKGKDLFLKPNFNSADRPPGSTHNDTLSGLVRRLQAMGADRITRHGYEATRSGLALSLAADEYCIANSSQTTPPPAPDVLTGAQYPLCHLIGRNLHNRPQPSLVCRW